MKSTKRSIGKGEYKLTERKGSREREKRGEFGPDERKSEEKKKDMTEGKGRGKGRPEMSAKIKSPACPLMA